MAKIIVVDDELSSHKSIKQTITPFLFKYEETINVFYFEGFNKQLRELMEDNSERKIYILDINLNSKITGVNIALKIREKDWDSEIIFLTNHDKYFDKVYRNIFKVFNFIEKFDHMEERLAADVNKILSKNYDNSMLKFKNSQIDLRIYMKDILYIHRDTSERKLVIRTTHNTFKISKTFNDILKDLDSRFKQVHRACIVNTTRVSEYRWSKGDFVLDTKEEVHLLSKKYKEEVA